MTTLRKAADAYAEREPLAGYVAIAALFAVAYGAGTVAAGRAGELPRRVDAGDVVLTGVAAHALSRLLTKKRITAFLRAPFTRLQGPAGYGEVDEAPREGPVRGAVGRLLVCPYCMDLWAAAALSLARVAAPRPASLVTATLAAYGLADTLQLARAGLRD